MNPPTILGAVGVALTADEMTGGMTGDAVPFHEVMAGAEVPRSDDIVVRVPVWRGLSFLGVLAWLVSARLATPGAAVHWHAPRKVVPSIRRTLGGLGWDLSSDGSAQSPPAGDPPEPPGFTAFGTWLDAGWGVFGGQRLDAGTEQLFDVVAAELGAGPVTVSDVGAGCGPLAIGLVLAGRASDVVMSEVDSVAVHLARRNAERAGVPHRLVFGDSPTAWPPTGTTVCNFPTHLPRAEADALLGGLVARARAEPVFVVVHASLRSRFEAGVGRHGASATLLAEASHAVLGITRKTR